MGQSISSYHCSNAMQFQLQWSVIKHKCCMCDLTAFRYLKLVHEFNGVGCTNPMIISLGKSAPFVAETSGPSRMMILSLDGINGFLLSVHKTHAANTLFKKHCWTVRCFAVR